LAQVHLGLISGECEVAGGFERGQLEVPILSERMKGLARRKGKVSIDCRQRVVTSSNPGRRLTRREAIRRQRHVDRRLPV
jgi:hypothetical protein